MYSAEFPGLQDKISHLSSNKFFYLKVAVTVTVTVTSEVIAFKVTVSSKFNYEKVT